MFQLETSGEIAEVPPRAAGAEDVAVDGTAVVDVPFDDQSSPQLDVVGISPGTAARRQAVDIALERGSELIGSDRVVGEDVVYRAVVLAGQRRSRGSWRRSAAQETSQVPPAWRPG